LDYKTALETLDAVSYFDTILRVAKSSKKYYLDTGGREEGPKRLNPAGERGK
jgi:hypothetical protein